MNRVKVRASERRLAVILCGGVAVGFALFKWFDPVHNPWFPPCPLYCMTRLYCPGCGTTRAIDSLISGSLRQALAYNPLFIAFGPWFALWGANQAAIATTGFGLKFKRVPTWIGWSVLALVLTFMLLRNLPVDALSWMRPHVL